MNFLIVSHMSWARSAGGPQVNVMLAEAIQKAGHCVDKYSFEDAFTKRGVWVRYFGGSLFPLKATSYVRRLDKEYDIIQADQGVLPASKRYMRTDATVVYNSHGLHHHHQSYGEKAPTRKERKTSGSMLGRIAGSLSNVITKPEFIINRSIRHADIISVQNQDEAEFAESHFPDKKVLRRPAGLSEERFSALGRARSIEEVDPPPTIAFIGVWNTRKGALDLPTVFRTVRRSHPEASLRLMGTGRSKNEVLRDFPKPLWGDIEVTPSYEYEELPGLLREITVGVLPSYIEGFGLAVLEMLAAGIPVVAYDVPGPRDTLGKVPRNLLVSAGEKKVMGEKLSDVLQLGPSSYKQLSRSCVQVASQFQWKDIAQNYISKLAEK